MNVPSKRFINETSNIHIFSLANGAGSRIQQLAEQNWTGRVAMGFKVPSWQRDVVWTQSQKSALIDSLYVGIGIPTIRINSTMDPQFDGILVDGLQRITAIHDYLSGNVAVAGDDGVSRTWSDLKEWDQKKFLRISIPITYENIEDETSLIELYRRLNFGGTVHEPMSEDIPAGSFSHMKPVFLPGEKA